MRTAAEVAYLLTLALWVGGIAVFTFLVTPLLFGHLGRDEAGRIVGFLFPAYFPYLLVLSLVALGTFGLLARGPWGLARWVTLLLLVAAVATNAYVAFRLHPQARAVKQEIASFETVPPDHPLRRRFRRLHAVSAALNLFVLGDGVALLLLVRGVTRP